MKLKKFVLSTLAIGGLIVGSTAAIAQGISLGSVERDSAPVGKEENLTSNVFILLAVAAAAIASIVIIADGDSEDQPASP